MSAPLHAPAHHSHVRRHLDAVRVHHAAATEARHAAAVEAAARAGQPPPQSPPPAQGQK